MTKDKRNSYIKPSELSKRRDNNANYIYIKILLFNIFHERYIHLKNHEEMLTCHNAHPLLKYYLYTENRFFGKEQVNKLYLEIWKDIL